MHQIHFGIYIPKTNKGGGKVVGYIGRHLRQLQGKLNISQDEMADSLCITQGTLSKYMTNKIEPSFNFIINIPKLINDIRAKETVLEWKKDFEEEFYKAIVMA